MRKRVSLFLALLLLLSLAGCSASQPVESTAPPTTTEASVWEVVPQILVPDLVGKSIYELDITDNYTVAERQRIDSDQPAGTILTQEPGKGTFADVGCTVFVTVSKGNGTETTLPEQTDPPATRPPATQPPQTDPPQTDTQLDPNGSYTTKEDVALFLHLYGRLPNNFVTKRQAEERYNWEGGSLSAYGMCIGGDRFYNNEGNLPDGYTYYECDIDTLYSSKRGAKRLVFTYTGIIYYTSDHYDTFTRLY